MKKYKFSSGRLTVSINARSEASARALAAAELNSRCRKRGIMAPAKWELELLTVDGVAINIAAQRAN